MTLSSSSVPDPFKSLKEEVGSDSTSNLGLVSDFFTLMKPGVMSLVVFTGFVGLIRAPGHVHPFLSLLVILAIALGSGAAGVINMWYDRDIDAVMKRTQNRPFPQQRILPESGLAFGILIGLLSLLIMVLAANLYAAALLAFSIFFYSIFYTMILKRRTPLNIVIGGAAGAFPPVIGWWSSDPSLSLEPWLYFLIILLWTPPHFWALALNKSDDYARACVPMLPNVKGKEKTQQQILLYSFLLVVSSILPWVCHFKGSNYLAMALGLNGVFIAYALKIYWKGTQRDCTRLFLFSILYLFLLFLGILTSLTD